MKRPSSLILTVAVSLAISACASRDTVAAKDVNESTFFRKVEVAYDAQASRILIFAEARVGGSTGTTVKFNPDTIQFNGESLKECDSVKDGVCENKGVTQDHLFDLSRIDAGTYYYLVKNVKQLNPSHSLTWKKADGTSETIIIPAATPLEISAEDALAWEGAMSVSDRGQKEAVLLEYRIPLKDTLNLSSWSTSEEVPQEPGQPFDPEAFVQKNYRGEGQPSGLQYKFVRQATGVPTVDGEAIRGEFKSVYVTTKQELRF